MAPEPEERRGARTGNLPPGYDVGIWEGLSVEVLPSREIDDRVRYLSYRFARNRAAVGRTPAGRPRRGRRPAVRSRGHAGSQRRPGPGVLEELLPIEVMDELSRTDNLVLQVDDRTADIPWELLGDRLLGVAPLACRSGLLRQFRVADLAVRKVARRANTALVFGDPPTNYHPLPGAREEAQDVARQLRAGRWMSNTSIPRRRRVGTSTSATLVRTALRGRDHRIIHIAAHGLTEVAAPPGAPGRCTTTRDSRPPARAVPISRTPAIEGGIPIGPGSLLIADDFRNLRAAPDFVFLNCCHLGRARPVEGPAGRASARPGRAATGRRQPGLPPDGHRREGRRCRRMAGRTTWPRSSPRGSTSSC